MNEHIKELAVKSGFPEWSNDTIGFEMEQFAKLIIKECIEIIENERYNTNMLLSMPGQSSAAYNAKWKIIERFGVK